MCKEGDPPPAAEQMRKKRTRVGAQRPPPRPTPGLGNLQLPRGRVLQRPRESRMAVLLDRSLPASGLGRFARSGKVRRSELPLGLATPRTCPCRNSPTETTELKRELFSGCSGLNASDCWSRNSGFCPSVRQYPKGDRCLKFEQRNLEVKNSNRLKMAQNMQCNTLWYWVVVASPQLPASQPQRLA